MQKEPKKLGENEYYVTDLNCLHQKDHRNKSIDDGTYFKYREWKLKRHKVILGILFHRGIETLFETTEQFIQIELGKYVLYGRPDIIEDKKVIEIKYTSKISDEKIDSYVLQAGLYAYALDLPRAEIHILTPYTYKVVEVNRNMIAGAVRIAQWILEEKVAPRFKFWCWYCPYNCIYRKAGKPCMFTSKK